MGLPDPSAGDRKPTHADARLQHREVGDDQLISHLLVLPPNVPPIGFVNEELAVQLTNVGMVII